MFPPLDPPIYRAGQGWRIDTFTIDRGNVYRYRVTGINHYTEELIRLGRPTAYGPAFTWRVPDLSGNGYYFGLREITQ